LTVDNICDRCYTSTDDGEHGHMLCPLEPRRAGVEVLSDSIPGGIWIKHGICNDDGTPKRYDSLTDIRRAANEKGWTLSGDTPKPYKVKWSGIQRERS
jgi:hypothetical protein